jgi:hypothetical protein
MRRQLELFPRPKRVAAPRPGRAGVPFAPCDDCGWDTMARKQCWEYYFVHKEIWLEAGLARCLCIGCLEKRLGRELRPEDFPPCESNRLSWHDTPRLFARKAGNPPHAYFGEGALPFPPRPSLIVEERSISAEPLRDAPNVLLKFVLDSKAPRSVRIEAAKALSQYRSLFARG